MTCLAQGQNDIISSQFTTIMDISCKEPSENRISNSHDMGVKFQPR